MLLSIHAYVCSHHGVVVAAVHGRILGFSILRSPLARPWNARGRSPMPPSCLCTLRVGHTFQRGGRILLRHLRMPGWKIVSGGCSPATPFGLNCRAGGESRRPAITSDLAH